MKIILLLTISNTFMNLAWYGHLKFKDQPLWIVILASWGLAFFEYLFQVPANRLGADQWTVPQLKVLQECITLVVFTGVAFLLFRTPIRWNIGSPTALSWPPSFLPSESKAQPPSFRGLRRQKFLRIRRR
jgi:uncharacterized protein (DUF486 family)